MKQDELDAYRHDREVIQKTTEQLAKDFAMSGIEIPAQLIPGMLFEELVRVVTPVISGVYRNEPAVFRALLYRIDMDEHLVRELEQSVSGTQFYSRLSESIIEKAFIKVLMKKLYSRLNG